MLTLSPILKPASSLATILFAAGALGAEPFTDSELVEIVVTAERREVPVLDVIGSTTRLLEDTIDRRKHQHVHELLTSVPGAWVSRGSGQEHLTAIRSPVLTGAGSCGAFLVLEDGLPIRPSGFCNVNQLFEVFSEAAAGVEVLSGPGNALYGSNALHGTLNFVMPSFEDGRGSSALLEFGANEFRRLQFTAGSDRGLGFIGELTDDGGFRDDTGFSQAKLHGRFSTSVAGGDLDLAMTLTDLDQETAGFILGEDAYLDPAVNRSNPNPEAFRDAESARLYGIWTRSFDQIDLDIRPFVRYSDMTFLQHFLPGQPLEENGQTSGGMNALARLPFGGGSLTLGIDAERASAFLKQTQSGPTTGSPFLVETRPPGKHYDYRVNSTVVAPYAHWRIPATDTVDVTLGLRAERARYDYDNRMADGNLRDDGTACGFGGCLYTRPADRRDTFDNIAPKLGAVWRLSPETALFASLARGFRAPQMTELYRLQSGQLVSDLDSETLDSFEVGWRFRGRAAQASFAIYAMKKKNSVLRDSEGFLVSRGQSRHRGAEFSAQRQIGSTALLKTSLSYGRHVYDFDLTAARGESFRRGLDVDTAPRWMGSLAWVWSPTERAELSFDWNFLSDYFLDAENQHTYPGHALLHSTLRLRLSERWAVTARVRNLLDAVIADRADYAFGNYRYFPGRGREFFLTLAYAPDGRRAD